MRALRLISISLLVVLAVPSVLADSFGLEDPSNVRSSAQLPGLSGVPTNDLLLTSNPSARFSIDSRQGSRLGALDTLAIRYTGTITPLEELFGRVPTLRSADGNPVTSPQFSAGPDVNGVLAAQTGYYGLATMELDAPRYGALLAVDSISQGLCRSSGLPPGGEFSGIASTIVAFSWDSGLFQPGLQGRGRPRLHGGGNPVTPVPEPGTLLLLGSGLLASATILRRKIAGRLSS